MSKPIGPQDAFVKDLRDRLGIPPRVRAFTVRCAMNEVVTVTCEYVPTDESALPLPDRRFHLTEIRDLSDFLTPPVWLGCDLAAEGKSDEVSVGRVIPLPPSPPPGRLIRDWSPLVWHDRWGAFCPKCGSSMMAKRWIIFGARPGCIQIDCENYGRHEAFRREFGAACNPLPPRSRKPGTPANPPPGEKS